MKILLAHDYGVLAGGAERITADLRDGLRARGHDVRLFASTARSLWLSNEADYTCYGTNAWPQRLLQVANPFAEWALRRVLAEFRPDVVHVRMFLTQLSPRILPVLVKVPALLHVGGYHAICPLGTRILPDESECTFRAGVECYRQGCVSPLGLGRTLLQLGSWRRHRGVFRRIVANSHALARTLRANDVNVSGVIPNGTRVIAARPSLDDPPTIACVGRLVARKGVDVLLDAMRIVVRRLPGARLLIAGDGPDRARIEGLVGSMSLAGCVTMRGHVADPQRDPQLSTAWVQAMPSRYAEPSANVIAEAMMRGTAVVATNIGGTPEMVRDGVTGFLVPPADAPQLADRLVLLLGDRGLSERLGAAGRSGALAELTTDRMIDRFESTYTEILQPAEPG
jgi:glycosyltransferase involved in cell wall biosynthesis